MFSFFLLLIFANFPHKTNAEVGGVLNVATLHTWEMGKNVNDPVRKLGDMYRKGGLNILALQDVGGGHDTLVQVLDYINNKSHEDVVQAYHYQGNSCAIITDLEVVGVKDVTEKDGLFYSLGLQLATYITDEIDKF